jgi:hypothetical protein
MYLLVLWDYEIAYKIFWLKLIYLYALPIVHLLTHLKSLNPTPEYCT